MSPTDAPRDLLTLAERDYRSALILAQAPDPPMESAGFHLQQAVEKSLKAWLALKGVDYPKTHDLSLLFLLLEDARENIEPFWHLLGLNPFAVQFRYEVAEQEFADFERLAQLTGQLIAHVQSLLAIG
ncbi:MAG: HEPN domain-containing protein [Planctomycetes bacterium]|jgi:HEPN domain-containing protein|nr:HEPN domain-containing protein [Planctomycetota bacterium]